MIETSVWNEIENEIFNMNNNEIWFTHGSVNCSSNRNTNLNIYKAKYFFRMEFRQMLQAAVLRAISGPVWRNV